MCKSNLDSLTKLDVTKTATLEAQRLEKDGLITELDTKREETLKLISELNKVRLIIIIFSIRDTLFVYIIVIK